MKLYIPLLALAVLSLSSCSTAYRTGQTPDDVYFSPARDKDEYVVVDKEDDRTYRGDDYYEDRYLRNRIRNPYRYSALDDYYNNPYAYNSYGYSYGGYGIGLGFNNIYSPWNSYYTWNNYYNPYYSGFGGHGGYGYGGYGGVIISNPRRYTPPSRAAAFNPRSYGVPVNSVRTQSYRPGYNPSNSAGSAPRYNNSNSRNNTLGGSVRRVFSNNNSNDNNSRSNSNNSTPTRSYNPPSSSSSSSSGGSSRSSGSSSGGGSRPIR